MNGKKLEIKRHPAYSVKGSDVESKLRAAYNLGGKHAAQALDVMGTDSASNTLLVMGSTRDFSTATREEILLTSSRKYYQRKDAVRSLESELAELRENVTAQLPEVQKLTDKVAELEKDVKFRERSIAELNCDLEDARDEIADLRRYKNPLFSIVAAIRKGNS